MQRIKERIVSVGLVGARLEVVRRITDPMQVAFTVPRAFDEVVVKDQVYKDIYVVVDGEIVLEETIVGEHIPSQTIPEQLVFDGST